MGIERVSKIRKELKQIVEPICEGGETEKYLILPGQFRKIIYKPSKNSVSLIRNHLSLYPSKKSRVASIFLPYLHYLPFWPKVELPRLEEFPGDVILKADRWKFFNLDNEEVRTYFDDKEKLKEEYWLRKALDKTDVKCPQILGRTDNLLIEKYAEVESLEAITKHSLNKINDFPRQLISFYKSKEISTSSIEEEVACVKERLDEDMLQEDSVTESIDLLEKNADQNVIRVTIHGDFHIGNLGLKGNNTYIFDWSTTRRGLLMEDFCFLFMRWHQITGNSEYLECLVQENPPREVKKLLEPYRKDFDIGSDLRFYLILTILKRMSLTKRNEQLYLRNLREITN